MTSRHIAKGTASLLRAEVIVIGAGASGLMCAIAAGRRGRSVLVIDHSPRAGSKVLASGGGRSNFTNLNAHSSNYFSLNPHFVKSALARFGPHDFIGMLKSHGIGFHEEEDGKMFLDRSSRDISEMLMAECEGAGVELELGRKILKIKKDGGFVLETDRGVAACQSLVVATGGLSYPKLGASGFGHKIAIDFGLKVTELRPGLVPLLFNPADSKNFGELSGVSTDVRVSVRGRGFRGGMLLTHRGLSGPAILNASLCFKQGDTLSIDLLPDTDAYGLFLSKRNSRVEMRNLLSGHMPKSLALKLCETYIQSRPMNGYSERELKKIAGALKDWKIAPSGTDGYAKAEVTVGGVDTDELSSKTMEAKKVEGLYFIGEVIDVAGELGGYNLQWAWSSGYAGGQYA